MSFRLRDIPGWIVLIAIALIALGGYGATFLFHHTHDVGDPASAQSADQMAAEEAAFQDEVRRQIQELGENGEVFKKAEAGDPGSQYKIGNVFLYGSKSQPADPAEAGKWFGKAAIQGNAAAAYQIGSMYARGDGVMPDRQEALRWWRKAAEGGDQWAQRHIGEIYLHFMAEQLDLKRDFEEAYFWLSLGTVGLDPNSNFIEHRESAKAELSAEQLEKAERRIKDWKPNAYPNACKESDIPRHVIELFSLTYFGPDNWTAELNTGKATPNQTPMDVAAIEPDGESVHVKWFDVCGTSETTLRPGEQYDEVTRTVMPIIPARVPASDQGLLIPVPKL